MARLVCIDSNAVWVRYILNFYKNKCKFSDVVYLYVKEGLPTSPQMDYQRWNCNFIQGPWRGVDYISLTLWKLNKFNEGPSEIIFCRTIMSVNTLQTQFYHVLE